MSDNAEAGSREIKKRTYEAVVIGASWGGMNAIIRLLKGLVGCCKLPVIIVLHRTKDSGSELAELIGRKTGLAVKEVEEKEPILPGIIYLAPADYHLLIESERTFSLDASDPENYSRPSIDVLFESAARVYGSTLIGIVLTGANSDGSRGLKKIAEAGGLTIVQQPNEAEVDTMPLAALRSTSSSCVYTLDEMRLFFEKLND